MINLLNIEGYNPGALLDCVMEQTKVRSDSALARALGTGAPAICKIRGKHAQMTPDLLIRMYDLTGRSIDELRNIAGIPKSKPTAAKPKRAEPIEPNEIVNAVPSDGANDVVGVANV